MPASRGRAWRRRGGGRLSVGTVAAGRYRIERELGRGGMATVFLAHDNELGRPVAIKILARHLASEPGFYDRFVREARMAARLAHPNVVQVFDAGEEDERRYIVMEYVPGHTLADELRARGRLAPARVVDLALQICGALELAHSSGLVHRDVKPQNLLLREDGTVKIADFGIARAAEATSLTEIGSILGTVAYLSPEQAAGEPVTAAADIYSLGVVLYELLTGRTPHEFRSLTDLAVKQREETIPPLSELEPSVPERLEAVVMRCLARNPDSRPASAAELARARRRLARAADRRTATCERRTSDGRRRRSRNPANSAEAGAADGTDGSRSPGLPPPEARSLRSRRSPLGARCRRRRLRRFLRRRTAAGVPAGAGATPYPPSRRPGRAGTRFRDLAPRTLPVADSTPSSRTARRAPTDYPSSTSTEASGFIARQTA